VAKGNKPVSYEEAHAPHYIAHRKGWLSLHTGEGAWEGLPPWWHGSLLNVLFKAKSRTFGWEAGRDGERAREADLEFKAR
jgi:hypothetical protein